MTDELALRALNMLNVMIEIDREATTELVLRRVKFNLDISNKSTVVVGRDGSIGIIGVLNGLLGNFRLCAHMEGETLLEFSLVENSENDDNE